MKTQKIPETHFLPMLDSFGMLVMQTSMYGAAHNVTVQSLQEAYGLLRAVVDKYGLIELALSDNAYLVNGNPVDAGSRRMEPFFKRFEAHKVHGIIFSREVTENEFQTTINLLSGTPASLERLGGFLNALNNARLKGVASTESKYRRVMDLEETEQEKHAGSSNTGVFSLDLGGNFDEFHISAETVDANSPLIVAGDGDSSNKLSLAERLGATRREDALKMASMLRATAALLENENQIPPGIGEKQILSSIERILKMVEASSQETREHINRLASQVEADRLTIATIESQARNRGVGINLTRSELLEQYAEINQEMLQPMTAAIGSLELLQSDKGGKIPPAQAELVRLAYESMQRVSQLLKYMSKISGLPETLTPDENVIKGTYS